MYILQRVWAAGCEESIAVQSLAHGIHSDHPCALHENMLGTPARSELRTPNCGLVDTRCRLRPLRSQGHLLMPQLLWKHLQTSRVH